ASATSAAALTRAPTAGAGAAGAVRSEGTGEPGLRNAGLGVTATPDIRDERPAISTNPSLRSHPCRAKAEGDRSRPARRRILAPGGGHERGGARVVLGPLLGLGRERGYDVEFVQHGHGGQLPGELPPRVVRGDPGAVGAPRPPDPGPVHRARLPLLEVG